jgi:hypothetical protein
VEILDGEGNPVGVILGVTIICVATGVVVGVGETEAKICIVGVGKLVAATVLLGKIVGDGKA